MPEENKTDWCDGHMESQGIGQPKRFVQDPVKRKLLEELKAKIARFSSEVPDLVRLRQPYSCKYKPPDRTAIGAEKILVTELDKWEEWVFEDMKEAILHCYPPSEKPVDALTYLRMQHHLFGMHNAAKLVGRDDEVTRITKRVLTRNKTKRQGLVVCGEPGVGKTAVMGAVLKGLEKARKDQLSRRTVADIQGKRGEAAVVNTSHMHIIAHFVGSCSGSDDLRLILQRFCLELRVAVKAARRKPKNFLGAIHQLQDTRRRGPAAPHDDDAEAFEWVNNVAQEPPPGDTKKLRKMFISLLRMACELTVVVLIVDGLDSLRSTHRAKTLDWLPSLSQLPSSLKLVLSANVVTDYNPDDICLDILKRRGCLVSKLKRLDVEHAEIVMGNLLGQYGKKLDSVQMAEMLSRQEARLPLYLTVAAEELRVFELYEGVLQRVKEFPTSLSELFMQLLRRLESDHGPALVRDSMCLVLLAREGLDEEEIQALTGVSVAQWTSLRLSLLPYLRYDDGAGSSLISFTVRQICEAAQLKYFIDEDPLNMPPGAASGSVAGGGAKGGASGSVHTAHMLFSKLYGAAPAMPPPEPFGARGIDEEDEESASDSEVASIDSLAAAVGGTEDGEKRQRADSVRSAKSSFNPLDKHLRAHEHKFHMRLAAFCRQRAIGKSAAEAAACATPAVLGQIPEPIDEDASTTGTDRHDSAARVSDKESEAAVRLSVPDDGKTAVKVDTDYWTRNWVSSDPDAVRALRSLPYHLIRAKKLREACEVLCDLQYIEAMSECGFPYEVVDGLIQCRALLQYATKTKIVQQMAVETAKAYDVALSAVPAHEEKGGGGTEVRDKVPARSGDDDKAVARGGAGGPDSGSDSEADARRARSRPKKALRLPKGTTTGPKASPLLSPVDPSPAVSSAGQSQFSVAGSLGAAGITAPTTALRGPQTGAGPNSIGHGPVSIVSGGGHRHLVDSAADYVSSTHLRRLARVGAALRFVQAEAHVLAKHPRLVFQSARNLPDSNPLVQVAKKEWKQGHESRPYLKWTNKPQHRSACVMTLGGHGDAVTAARYSPDGSFIASACMDGKIRIWDTQSGDLTRTMTAGDTGVTCLEFCPHDTRWLVAGLTDGRVLLWDYRSSLYKEIRRVSRSMRPKTTASEVSMGSRGSRRASHDADFEKIEMEEQLESDEAKKKNIVSFISISVPPSSSPKGARHSAEPSPSGAGPDDGALSAALRPGSSVRTGTCAHSSWVTCVEWNTRGTFFATGDKSGVVCLWDVTDGAVWNLGDQRQQPRLVRVWQAHRDAVRTIGFVPRSFRPEDTLMKTGHAVLGEEGARLKREQAREAAAGVGKDGPFSKEAVGVRTGGFSVSGPKDGIVAGGVVISSATHQASPLKTEVGISQARVTSPSFDDVGLLVTTGGTLLSIWSADWAGDHDSTDENPGVESLGGVSGSTLGFHTSEKEMMVLLRNSNMELKALSTLSDGKVNLREESGITALNAVYNARQRIAIGCIDGSVRVYRTDTGRRVGNLQGHSGAVLSCTYSHDGHHIASAGEDGTVRVWVPALLSAKSVSVGHKASVAMVSFSKVANNRQVATASVDGNVRVWLTEQTRPFFKMNCRSRNLSSVRFTNTANTLAATSVAGLRLWSIDITNPAAPPFRDVTTTGIGYCDFNMSGSAVAYTELEGSKGLTIANADTGRWVGAYAPVKSTRIGMAIKLMKFSPDGRLIVTAAENGLIMMWDTGLLPKNTTTTAQSAQSAKTSHEQPILVLEDDTATTTAENLVNDFQFSPNGKSLLCVVHAPRVKLWDLQHAFVAHHEKEKGGVVPTELFLKQLVQGHELHVLCAKYSPDGQAVLSGGADGRLLLWNLQSMEVQRQLAGHDGAPVENLRYSPNGARMVSSAADKTVRIWSRTGDLIATWLQAHPISTFELDTLGETLVVGDTSGGVSILALEGDQLNSHRLPVVTVTKVYYAERHMWNPKLTVQCVFCGHRYCPLSSSISTARGIQRNLETYGPLPHFFEDSRLKTECAICKAAHRLNPFVVENPLDLLDTDSRRTSPAAAAPASALNHVVRRMRADMTKLPSAAVKGRKDILRAGHGVRAVIGLNYAADDREREEDEYQRRERKAEFLRAAATNKKGILAPPSRRPAKFKPKTVAAIAPSHMQSKYGGLLPRVGKPQFAAQRVKLADGTTAPLPKKTATIVRRQSVGGASGTRRASGAARTRHGPVPPKGDDVPESSAAVSATDGVTLPRLR